MGRLLLTSLILCLNNSPQAKHGKSNCGMFCTSWLALETVRTTAQAMEIVLLKGH